MALSFAASTAPLSLPFAAPPRRGHAAVQATRPGVPRASLPSDSKPSLSSAESPVERRSVVLLGAALAPLAALAQAPALAADEGVCELQEGGLGLQFCDTLLGSGYQPSPGDLIKCHYTGRLLNGTVFDTSYKRGRPLSFRIGVGEVIRGWDLGILGEEGVPPMLAGGRRTLRIPATLAYGVRGAGCRGGFCVIPPNSDLIFEVELVGKA